MLIIILDSEREFTPVEWAALIAFLRSNTKLRALQLDNQLSEEQTIELIDAIKENTALTSLKLEGRIDFNHPRQLIIKIRRLQQFV